MIGYIIKKVIGSKNDREVKRLRPLVTQVNEFEAALQSPLRRRAFAKRPRIGRPAFLPSQDNAELAAGLGRNHARSFRDGEECLPPVVRARNHRPRTSVEVGHDSL